MNGNIMVDDTNAAAVMPNGNRVWYKNGLIHRDNGPAMIFKDGTEVWYHKDRRHREDGPAYICPSSKESMWFIDGMLHRDGHPAIIQEGQMEAWYKRGRLHREDGPAVIKKNHPDEYWLDGVKFDTWIPISLAPIMEPAGATFQSNLIPILCRTPSSDGYTYFVAHADGKNTRTKGFNPPTDWSPIMR